MKKALLVGGKQQLLPVLTKKLSAHHDIGVAAWWEVDSDASAKLPAGCELVILLIDMISHPLQDKVIAMAKSESVPFIRAEGFRWSSMSTALTAKGYKVEDPAKESPMMKREFVVVKYLKEFIWQNPDASNEAVRAGVDGKIGKDYPTAGWGPATDAEIAQVRKYLGYTTPVGTPQRPPEPPTRVARISKKEALRRLREYLEEHPGASNQEINQAAIAKAQAEIPGLHTRTFKNGDIATVRRELLEAAQNAAQPAPQAAERAEEPAATGVSVEAEKTAVKVEPEKGTPTWYTEDFKAALALLRVEMLKASITEITNLNADGFEFERVEIVRGRL